MDQTTNPLQRFLDLKDQDFQLTPFEHQDKYFAHQSQLNSYHQYQDKNLDKNQFFTSSPNPFLKQCPVFQHYNLTPQKNCKNNRNEHFIEKKLNFQELQIQSPLKSFTFQKYNEQNEYSSKKQFQEEDQQDYSQQYNCTISEKIVFQKQAQCSVKDKHIFSNQKMKRTKQAKGLKGLSQNVYQIVRQEGITSYNKVAIILIQQMKQNSKIYGHIFDGRDEQNIKRRVYDALNVLISAEVLRKNNKSVTIDKELFTDSIFSRTITQRSKKSKISKKDFQQTKKQLIEEVKLKKFALSQKRETLNKLLIRRRNIQSFIKKNIQLTQNQLLFQIGVQDQQGVKNYQKEQLAKKIHFPFICLNLQNCSKKTIKYTVFNLTNENKNLVQSRSNTTASVWEKENSSTLSHHTQNLNDAQLMNTSIALTVKTDSWTVFGDVDFVIEGNYQEDMNQRRVSEQINKLNLQDSDSENLAKNQSKCSGKKKAVQKIQNKSKVATMKINKKNMLKNLQV